MTTEEKLKSLILSRYKSIREFVNYVGLPYATVDSILRRGVNNASVGNVIKICHSLQISADELSAGKIVPIGQKLQAKKPMKDIRDIIEFTKINISEYKNLTIDGDPITDAEKEMLLDGLEIAQEIIIRKRKRESK